MKTAQTEPRSRYTRKPMVTVVHTLGGKCPAGYHPGERFAVDLFEPEDSFLCSGGYKALEPLFDMLGEQPISADLPACRFVASCDCPISNTEGVFYFYTVPALRD